jgi:hypothetical protein
VFRSATDAATVEKCFSQKSSQLYESRFWKQYHFRGNRSAAFPVEYKRERVDRQGHAPHPSHKLLCGKCQKSPLIAQPSTPINFGIDVGLLSLFDVGTGRPVATVGNRRQPELRQPHWWLPHFSNQSQHLSQLKGRLRIGIEQM